MTDVSILDPNKISREKHKMVRQFIINLFQKGKLMFADFLKYFGETVETDFETALIIVYYANNTLKNNPNISIDDRNDTITAMLADLNKLYQIDYNKYLK